MSASKIGTWTGGYRTFQLLIKVLKNHSLFNNLYKYTVMRTGGGGGGGGV